MASNSETMKLIIRTANNKHADFYVELSPSSTIYDLKQNITVNHPTKTGRKQENLSGCLHSGSSFAQTPTDQRLVFSGKLLDDSRTLSQVFLKATTGSTFMVHLVLDSDKTATTPKPPQPAPPVPEPPLPTEKPVPSSHSSSYEQYLEQLNKYQQQLQQFVIDPNGSPSTSNYETQAYLQYCYTHYQMYQNLLAYQRTVAPTATSAIPPSAPATSTAPAAEVAVGAAAAAPQPAAANNNNEMEQENDLLGVLNMLVELFVLCSIVYFYSTFSRFLLVFVFFTLLYLHCRGYLSLRRRPRVQPRPPPVVPEPVADNDGEDDAEAEPVANGGQNQNDIQRQRPPSPARGPTDGGGDDVQISATRLLFTAVSTFFSSLIPERPQRA